jgi:hypothetical protein
MYMKKIVMVGICTALLVAIPFTSMAVSPKPLVPEHLKVTFTPNSDPDGPFAGCLDDPSDWANLVNGIGCLFLVGGSLMTLLLVDLDQQKPFSIFLTIAFIPYNAYLCFYYFTEAFDMRDGDGDGC